jgi:hypothetical protein
MILKIFFSRTTGPKHFPEERGFKFIQMQENAPLQGEIIEKE